MNTDIPENIKKAAARPELINGIGAYFNDNIIGGVISQMQVSAMYAAMIKLVMVFSEFTGQGKLQ